MRQRAERGFTMLELLVVVLIIGVLAAIAIVNYISGLERGRQKRTMVDIRAIATAWESRASETGSYNAAAAFDWPTVTISQSSARDNLTPTWIRSLPATDGWGNPFDFGLDQAMGAAQKSTFYAIRSRGRDNIADPNYDLAGTERFDCDIVYSNGAFVVFPEGIQH